MVAPLKKGHKQTLQSFPPAWPSSSSGCLWAPSAPQLLHHLQHLRVFSIFKNKSLPDIPVSFLLYCFFRVYSRTKPEAQASSPLAFSFFKLLSPWTLLCPAVIKYHTAVRLIPRRSSEQRLGINTVEKLPLAPSGVRVLSVCSYKSKNQVPCLTSLWPWLLVKYFDQVNPP